MTDRDPIAEACAERDEARTELQQLHNDTQEAFAAITVKQQRDTARIAELEQLVTGLDKDRHAAYERETDAVMRAEKAEAAQRPPLGYIAVGKRADMDGTTNYQTPSLKVWPDIDRCRMERGKFEIEDEDRSDFLRREYVVAEVREVQP